MNQFRISLDAKEDLRRIYQYGIVEYGEVQADKYFLGLFDTFEKIAINPYIYQTVDEVRPGYRRCTYHSDSVYFKINGAFVEIMAILGGQDIDEWL